jgi:hypothetical protein
LYWKVEVRSESRVDGLTGEQERVVMVEKIRDGAGVDGGKMIVDEVDKKKYAASDNQSRGPGLDSDTLRGRLGEQSD